MFLNKTMTFLKSLQKISFKDLSRKIYQKRDKTTNESQNNNSSSFKLSTQMLMIFAGCSLGYFLSKYKSALCEKSQIVYHNIGNGHLLSYPANNPIEDRMIYAKLKSIDAEIGAVFDGHGGFSVFNLKSRLHL